MMNRKILRMLLIGIALLLITGCTAPSQESGLSPEERSGAAEQAGQGAAGELANYLVQAEGSIQIRRSGWEKFLPAGFGALVEPGDLLKVDTGGLASVFCGSDASWDDSLVPLAADGLEHGVPCQNSRPPRPWEDVAALRGASDGELPYIITPRNTALRNPMPTLRWHQLSEVETYTVSLIGEDLQERPEVQTSSVEITWPEDWPPLESGASYVLVVKAGERASNDGNQSNVGLGFWLLDEQEIERVGGLETALQAQNVGFPGEDLLLAELLIKYQLRAEASSVLERAISAQPSAALWLTYGKVLLETGLVHEALESFDQGLQASQAAGLADFEAESLIGLGLVYRQMGDQEGSQANFQQAVEVFQQIGDQGRLAEVSELMDKR